MKINQLKAGTLLTYLTMGIGFLISLIYTPIMIRLLGQSEYGLYNLAASVIAYLGVLNFGFGSAYIRYYYRFKANNDQEAIAKLNGMFLVIFSLIAVIALVGGFILAYFSNSIFGDQLTRNEMDTAKILLIILTINLAIKFPNIVFVSFIRANERFIFEKIIELFRTIVNPFLVLPILYLGYGSTGMALAITITSLLVEISYMLYSFKKLNISFKLNVFDKVLFKEMTIFSSFIFINLVIDQINWNVDKFILGYFHGTVPVAIYSLAAVFSTQYLSISTAVSSVFVPRVHKLATTMNGKLELTVLFAKVGRIQFIILSLFLSGFILFGKPFIFWWAGVDYRNSYYIILILTTAVTIPIIQNLGIEMQRALNLHKFRSIIYLVIAILNIGITIPLVIYYEGIGASIGTALSLLIGNGLIMNIYYHKKMGIDIIYFWKEILKIFPAFVFPVIIGGIFINYYDISKLLYFLIGLFLYSIVFIVSMWYIGMNKYEKDLLIKPLSIIINKLRG